MRYTVLVVTLCFLCCISANAQQSVRLSGVVKTTENEALPYANIRLMATNDTTKVYGGSTDGEGAFSVSVPHDTYVLDISYIGYLKQTASVRLDSVDVNISVSTGKRGSNN